MPVVLALEHPQASTVSRAVKVVQDSGRMWLSRSTTHPEPSPVAVVVAAVVAVGVHLPMAYSLPVAAAVVVVVVAVVSHPRHRVALLVQRQRAADPTQKPIRILDTQEQQELRRLQVLLAVVVAVVQSALWIMPAPTAETADRLGLVEIMDRPVGMDGLDLPPATVISAPH